MTEAVETSTKEAPAQLEQPLVPQPDELQAKALARAQETSRSLAAQLFTAERVALIKKQICPAGITDGDFAVFLEQCRRSGLDPLMKEAWCVPRKVKVKRKTDKGYDVTEDVEVHVFQAAEQGMQVRAHRSGVFLGMRAGAVYEHDTCEIDFAGGRVKHVAKMGTRGKLLGAWAIAFRSDLAVSPVAWVNLSEYLMAEAPLWKGKPETMIVKVARAHALRLSFPFEFAGAFIPEELDAGPIPEEMANGVDTWLKRAVEEAAPSQPATTRAEQVKQRLDAAKPKPTPPRVTEIPMDAMRFGPAKGKKLAECTGADLATGLAEAEKAIAENPGAVWASSVAQRIDAMKAEQSRRFSALTEKLDEQPTPQDGAPARQPGEEG